MNDKNSHTNEDDLSKEAPFLFGLKKEEPFRPPDGYFEKFPSELSERLISEKSSWWSIFLKPVVWAPAMVLLIVSGIFLFRNEDAVNQTSVTKMNETPELNELSFEVLDAYVTNHLLAQIDSDEIMEIVGTEDLPSLGNSPVPENITEMTPSIGHVEKEEMEEYIMENIDEMEIY